MAKHSTHIRILDDKAYSQPFRIYLYDFSMSTHPNRIEFILFFDQNVDCVRFAGTIKYIGDVEHTAIRSPS